MPYIYFLLIFGIYIERRGLGTSSDWVGGLLDYTTFQSPRGKMTYLSAANNNKYCS